MSELIIYQADGGAIDVRLEGETVWLSQEQITTLFGRDRTVIGRHIRNVFEEGELERDSVCAKFAHTARDGKTYPNANDATARPSRRVFFATAPASPLPDCTRRSNRQWCPLREPANIGKPSWRKNWK